MCDQVVSFDNFKVLASVTLSSIFLVSCDEPVLNKKETSLPLYLFD